MIRKHLSYFGFIGLVVFIITSCDSNRVYENYSSISSEGWHKDSVIHFEVDISDTASHHNLYINFRNSIDYSYRNLWIFMSVIPPEGEAIIDTMEFTLANPAGKWFGKGMGKVKDIQFLFRRNVFFPDSGVYNFQIQQGMRDQKLSGIIDVGFRVEKSK